MSSDALPISPARFAEAIKDLSLSSLHLKVLELRNSIAHLDYSNEQLRPFAEGTESALDGGGSTGGDTTLGRPDQDCIDAIRENEEVIARMQERICLIREEVEGRGFGWTEFQSKEEVEAEHGQDHRQEAADAMEGLVNGRGSTGAAAGLANGERPSANGAASHQAWADGTFQTGTIRNGEVHFDAPSTTAAAAPSQGGGRLTDEQLRRALQERLAEQEDEEEGGMHL